MTPTYTIAGARPEDLACLAAIEVAAVTLFTGPVFDSVPHEPTSLTVLEKAQREGRLWVARAGQSPVGFALVGVIESGAAHLEEIDVHPDHGRRGLGTTLVEHVCQWAASAGHAAVTLDDLPRRAVEHAVLRATGLRGGPRLDAQSRAARARRRRSPSRPRSRDPRGHATFYPISALDSRRAASPSGTSIQTIADALSQTAAPAAPCVNRRNASDAAPNAVVPSTASSVPVRTASTGLTNRADDQHARGQPGRQQRGDAERGDVEQHDRDEPDDQRDGEARARRALVSPARSRPRQLRNTAVSTTDPATTPRKPATPVRPVARRTARARRRRSRSPERRRARGAAPSSLPARIVSPRDGLREQQLGRAGPA